MNRTLRPAPSGDDLLFWDENTSRNQRCLSIGSVRTTSSSGVRGTRTHPRIETVVITIIVNDVYPANRGYKGVVGDRMVTDRNTSWIVAVTTAGEGGQGPPYAFSPADRCTTMYIGMCDWRSDRPRDVPSATSERRRRSQRDVPSSTRGSNVGARKSQRDARKRMSACQPVTAEGQRGPCSTEGEATQS